MKHYNKITYKESSERFNTLEVLKKELETLFPIFQEVLWRVGALYRKSEKSEKKAFDYLELELNEIFQVLFNYSIIII